MASAPFSFTLFFVKGLLAGIFLRSLGRIEHLSSFLHAFFYLVLYPEDRELGQPVPGAIRG